MRFRQVFTGITLVALATSGLVALGPTPSAGANPAPGIPPDFILSPNGPVVTREVKTTLVGAPNQSPNPDACRNSPVFSNVCDVFRLKLNLSTKPGAQNFVIIFLDFEATRRPDFAIPLLNTPDTTVPELDLVVYRTPIVALPAPIAGGQDFQIPERVAWIAGQSEYDLVVKNDQGVAQSYTLRMFMTDEIFANQFELLEDAKKRIDETAPPPQAPIDEGTFASPPEDVRVEDPNALPSLAPVIPQIDRRLTGVGLAPRSQFDIGAPQAFGGGQRRVVKIGDAPSGISLVLFLLVLPLLAAAAGAVWLRRRRQALV